MLPRSSTLTLAFGEDPGSCGVFTDSVRPVGTRLAARRRRATSLEGDSKAGHPAARPHAKDGRAPAGAARRAWCDRGTSQERLSPPARGKAESTLPLRRVGDAAAPGLRRDRPPGEGSRRYAARAARAATRQRGVSPRLGADDSRRPPARRPPTRPRERTAGRVPPPPRRGRRRARAPA